MYDEYFYSVQNVYKGQGWYMPNPGRTNLDWLTRYAPEPTGTVQVPRSGGRSQGPSGQEHALGYVIDADRPDLGGNLRHGDIHTWCPETWRYLVERYGAASVLDVGCGEGHAVRFFHRLGLVAHGINGLDANVRRALVPVAKHDLNAGPYCMPVDLVWCCEVAEHIAEDKVDHLIDPLANGRVVAMTHAVPGQAGHHHVNCQPREYWIARMEAKSYRLSPDLDTFLAVSRTERTWNHFSNSGLVFVRV